MKVNSTNDETKTFSMQHIQAFERFHMIRINFHRPQRSSQGVMEQRSSANGACPLSSRSRQKPNGFLLAEALLALMIAVLCGFLLMTSLAAYRNALKKGVPVKIEERIPGRTPYV